MVQSNCHIELDRGPNTNPQEKLFNLRGLPQNIQAAQNLIRQKLEVHVHVYVYVYVYVLLMIIFY